MAFEMLEPFGPPGTAYAAGVIASTLANVNRGKNTEPFWPENFMEQIYRRPKDAEGNKRRRATAKKRLIAAKVRSAFSAIPEADRPPPEKD